MAKKGTKKALIASVLSMTLSASMLVGTTFAWFTDEVESGVNTIVAGNLDVELTHKGAGDGGFTSVKGATNLFKNKNGGKMLWEPNASSSEIFEVSNEGSLALKYTFEMNYTNATKTPEGKTLADVLTATIKTPDGETTTSTLADFSYSSTLTAEKSEQFEVTIAWPQSANDNAFNVEGGLKIDLGVSVFASQYTYEYDGIDNGYDQGAGYAATVFTAADLHDALSAGRNVILGADIDLTGYAWTPVGTSAAPFGAEFDGNGKTLSGLSITSGDYAGLFGYVSGATIKNVNLADVEVSGGKRMGALAGQINGDAVIENCTVSGRITGSDSNTGGLIGEIINGTVQLTKLTNNAAVSNTATSDPRAGGIVGQVTTGANVTLKDCVNNGGITAAGGYAGGIVSAYQSGTLTFDNCKNNGPLTGKYDGNMLGWYTSVRSITIYTDDNAFDENAIGCVDIQISSNMSLYGQNYFVNKNTDVTGVTDRRQDFEEIFAEDKIGTAPYELWNKLIAFYTYAKQQNSNFAGYPETYWEIFDKSNVGFSADWNGLLDGYNAQCSDGYKLEKGEFSSQSWRATIVYLVEDVSA